MRRILVLPMAAIFVVLMGSSAQATIRDITDPPGDVVRATLDPNGDHFERLSQAEGDIGYSPASGTPPPPWSSTRVFVN